MEKILDFFFDSRYDEDTDSHERAEIRIDILSCLTACAIIVLAALVAG